MNGHSCVPIKLYKNRQQARYGPQAIVCLLLLWADASMLLCSSQCLIWRCNSWDVLLQRLRGSYNEYNKEYNKIYTTTPPQKLGNGEKRWPSQRFMVRTRLNALEYAHTKSMKKATYHHHCPLPQPVPVNYIHIFKKRLCLQKGAWAGSAREI